MEFIALVLVMELTPGPNMSWLAVLAILRGRATALLAVAGVAVGLAVHAALAAMGLGVLIAASETLHHALRWLGMGVMLFLAWEAWRDAGRPMQAAAPLLAGGVFWRGLLANLFNAKSILFFVTVVPGFGSTGGEFGVLGAIYVLIATAIHVGVVLAAARLAPWLEGSGQRRGVQRVLALGLVGVALWLGLAA
ncbi:MAG: LysE family translocator [Alphaproteobacteria bacterium]|nr:LysE family translocator [Alphaproteobacteria bacterium]